MLRGRVMGNVGRRLISSLQTQLRGNLLGGEGHQGVLMSCQQPPAVEPEVRGGGLLHWVLTVVPLLPCLAGEEAEAQTGWLTSQVHLGVCRAELHNSSLTPRACAMRQHHTPHMKLNVKRTENAN